MLAAIAIFATAAAVAVVQATGSDDSTESEPAEEAVVSPTGEESNQAEPDPSAPNGSAAAQQTSSSDEQQQEPNVQVAEQAAADEAEQPQTAEQQAPTTTNATDHPLRGFITPIAGACITEFPGHLPSSLRAYRNDGVHEGFDFYEWASCTAVNVGTEILAAKAGVVIRADVDYVDITPADWQRFIDANWEGEAILDELRGRQVWIDHGRGIVTRYAHLSAIAQGIAVGVEVQQGQLIGYPGESGQQEVYANPGTDIHLHFEIRVGEGWLGEGESQEEARQLYLQAFGLAD